MHTDPRQVSESMQPVHLVVVPHTHWDREWYQPFQEFRTRLVRLMDGLLDTLERDPAFTHFHLDGQTIVLEDAVPSHSVAAGDERHRPSGATGGAAGGARRCLGRPRRHNRRDRAAGALHRSGPAGASRAADASR